jgi:hypothetical protein
MKQGILGELSGKAWDRNSEYTCGERHTCTPSDSADWPGNRAGVSVIGQLLVHGIAVALHDAATHAQAGRCS